MFKLRRYLLYVFQSYECTDLGRVLWRELGHNHTNCHPVPIHGTSGCFSGQTWDLDHHPALHLCRHVCLGEGRVPANTLNWSMHTHQYGSTLHTYSQSSINTHPPTHTYTHRVTQEGQDAFLRLPLLTSYSISLRTVQGVGIHSNTSALIVLHTP